MPLTDVTGVRLHDSDSKKLVVEWPDIVHTFKCSSSADAQEWVEALTKLLADQLPRSRSRVWPEQDMSRPGIGQNEDTPRVEDKHGLNVSVASCCNIVKLLLSTFSKFHCDC